MTDHHTISESKYGSGHGTLKSYIIGFILSILLTIIPYELVVGHLLTGVNLVASVVIFGVLQLLVQLIFFLHLSSESKPRWNLAAFIFTVLVVVILVVGTIWIMYNLNINMVHNG